MAGNSLNDGTNEIQQLETRYTWRLNNFSSYMQYKVGERIESRKFNTKFGGKEQVWWLGIYPSGFTTECQGYVSLLLCGNSECTVKYKLSILDQTDTEQCVCKEENDTFKSHGWFWDKFVNRDELFRENSKLIVNGALTILCVISNTETKTIPLKVDGPKDQLSRDLADLLKSSRLSDLTITVGDRKFHVHRNILAARSPVFSAMLEYEFKKTSGNIDIPDIDPKTIEALLNFIYTGECPNTGDVTEDLIRASDKYQLEDLKDICSDYMSARITAGNAPSLLLTADMHNAPKLKEKVLEFVINHFKDIRITEGWKNLSTTNPSLSVEVQERVLEHFLPNN